MTDTIYLVVGESGSGKDTVINHLVKRNGIRRIDSYTTRPCRGPGDRHIFVDDYFEWVAQNPNEVIVGYTEFDGHYYWATATQVARSDVYIIDPDGVRFFRNTYMGSKCVRVIYFNVPLYKRFFRMLRRGDGIFKAIRRLLNDGTKFDSAMKLADYVVNDGAVEEMAENLLAYMRKN